MTHPARASGPVRAAVFCVGISALMTQLALMREMLSAYAGNEMVLGILLGNWLWLTGLGTWLGRFVGAGSHGRRGLWIAQMAIAWMPFVQVVLMRLLRNLVFVRGAAIGLMETVSSSALVLSPFCVMSGAFLTIACGVLGETEGELAPGRVYVADGVGSVVGGLLFTLLLVFRLDHFVILAIPAVLNSFAATWVAIHRGSRFPAAISFGATLALPVLLAIIRPDAVTTTRQFPGEEVLYRGHSPYGRVVVTRAHGQINVYENGVPAFNSQNILSAEERVHFAMVQRPGADRVLLISGGVSGTAKEVLKYEPAEVVYVELDPVILEIGKRFLEENLDPERLRVINTDGRLYVREARTKFDVAIVDLPDPATTQLNRFYTAEFFAEVKQSLNPGGVLSLSLGGYQNFVSEHLARLIASLDRTLREGFTNVVMIPAGQVFFLASDGGLSLDIAPRLAAAGIRPQGLTPGYLGAVLRPDRLADLERARGGPASVNRDLSPVLYYYHLRHWVSQFALPSALFVIALGGFLVVYLVCLRPPSLALFASGFAGASLEVVILLVYQVLCGALYHQLGLIVTVFMAGLVTGAMAGNRLPKRLANRTLLAALAGSLTVLALLLPWSLGAVSRAGNIVGAIGIAQGALLGLTFVLAFLAGLEFPVASRAQGEPAAQSASRLYTADFLGASLGALITSAWLIPRLGVRATCLAVGGLNAVAAVVLIWRRCHR